MNCFYLGIGKNTDFFSWLVWGSWSAYIEAINTTDEIQATRLNAFIEKLETEAPEDLYIAQLESISIIENPDVSGMGLIMLMHDYHANLGIRIIPRIDDAHGYDVSISVALEHEVIEAA